MATNIVNINLRDYCTNSNYDFLSRTHGIAVRNASQIDHFIQSSDLVKIFIPKEVFSMSQSFLEEFLESSIAKLGRRGFEKKVEFISEGRYNVKLDLEEVINRVLEVESIYD